MKKCFHVFFLFTLIAFFATMANAETAELQTDPNTGDKFVNVPADGRTLEVDIPEGVTSFKVHVDEYEIVTRVFGGLILNAPQGYILQVGGLDLTEMYIDGLHVEDVNTSQNLWGSGYYPSQAVYSTGRSVEVRFQTYEENFTLDLIVTLIDVSEEHEITVASTNNGTVTSDPTEAAYGETVDLLINPATDYMLASMTVVDNSGKAVIPTAGWYSGNTVSFTMPMEAVTVTPVFVPEDYSNLSINMPEAAMPESETVNAVIPEGVTSFKVYDGGGENAGGNIGTTGQLVLTAPLGHILEVTGTISSGGDDVVARLIILNGNTTGSQLLSTMAVGEDIPVSETSSGNVLTISFAAMPYMGFGESAANMDLTVTVTSVPSHEITLGDYTHGTIQLSKNEAYPGETITLTTTAESGYILADIEVLDGESNPVDVTGIEWSANNTATFVMPNGGVVVTPRFTNNPTAEGGLYRRMQSGWAEFIVPEGVKSFKLYAAQSDYCNPNRAVLSSADDRTFLIEGSISSEGRLYLGDGDIDDVDPDLQQASYYGFRSTIVGPYRSVKSAVKFDYGGECEDVEFTVSLVKTTQYAAITVEEVGTTTTATIDGSYTDDGEVVIASDVAVDTVVFNRNFATGAYSTIVLPFSIKAGNVEGAEFYHLTGFEKVDGKWKTALISKVNDNDNLVANTPYLLEASETNLIFKPGGVPLTLNTTEKHPYTFESEDKSGYWEFRGTYEYIDYANDRPELLGSAYGFAAKTKNDYKVGDFAKLKTGAYTPAMRAYLVYNDGPMPQGGESMTKSALGSGIPSDLPETLEVVIVNDEGKSIGGGTINTVTGQIRMNHWYDLQGRKLNGKPTTKGTYYHKGKLVIIK